MQTIDAAAISDLGIPRVLLMDHAGLAVARAARELCRGDGSCLGFGRDDPERAERPEGSVLVCCGTGFNGGDGLAAARHLSGWGYSVRVLLAGELRLLREEPAVFAGILRRLGVPMAEVTTPQAIEQRAPWWAEARLIIDALLGIGLSGPTREPTTSLIQRINASGKPVVAADIPSGLDGDTGLPHGEAVNASVTVAFGLPKQGCRLARGPAHVGRLLVDPITIPDRLLQG